MALLLDASKDTKRLNADQRERKPSRTATIISGVIFLLAFAALWVFEGRP